MSAIKTIDVATYATERAICDKAEATLKALWPAHAKGGMVPAIVSNHPDYVACDNAMRGRVEQFEILRDLPERIFAYVGQGKLNGMGLDRVAGQTFPVTTWTGDAIGYATMSAGWRVRSFVGSRMYQIYARIGGREYTGRGFGAGMCVALRETAESKRKRAGKV